MSQNAFLSAIQKITSSGLALNELIAAAQTLAQTGQSDLSRQLYQLWINTYRDHPLVFIAQFNCSTLLQQAGDEAGGEAMLRAALEANPDFAPARINLGSALERRGAAGEGVEQWKIGLDRLGAVTGDAIDYKNTLLKQISRVASDNQQLESAEAALQQSIELNPDQRDVIEQYGAARLAQCKWPIAAIGGKLTRPGFVGRFHPLSACAYADDPLQHLAIAARYVDAVCPPDSYTLASDRRNAAIDTSARRLRIGYVSSDLRFHAVGFLMANLFEAHDAANVEVFVYYCGIPSDDAITQRVKTAVAHWTDIRKMSDDEAAAAIARDEIDILIDVNGHTRDARLGVFARRPAPVIVNWLGYPGTMGSAFHNYVVADDFIIPTASELYYSERVLRLPCYQPNDRKRVVAENRPTRAEAGLPDDAFVFACFNAAHKITRFSFERWCEILRATPGSVLWLLDFNAETNLRLAEQAEARGVESKRLIHARKIANPHHLARYPLADLVLDTTPYGAHTTASDALWMGVPVLTLAGRSFAARVCGSLLQAAGLPELITETPADFVSMATSLAGQERDRLDAYRTRLAANRDTCALFDIDLLARRLEGLYQQMARDHCAGATPQPNLANLEAYLDIGARFDHDTTEIGLIGDYDDLYRQALAARQLKRPMIADGRLWNGETPTAADTSAPPVATRAA